MKITINTKNLKSNNPKLQNWIDLNGVTFDLVEWYLSDSKSRRWLEKYCYKLEKEYMDDLSGDTKIRWNHLYKLLYESDGMKQSIKVTFFNTFLYGNTNKKSINELVFIKQGDDYVPVSLQ